MMRGILLSMIAATVVSACGTVRYVYSQLDWLVPWYVRDYVTLDREQRALLDERLAARLQWHCSTQLPEYVSWFAGVQDDLARSRLDPLLLERRIEEAGGLWDETAESIGPDLAALLATLRDEQVEELFRNLDERNAETHEEFLEGDAEARHERRVERMEKRLRRWFGRFERDQTALIEAWSRDVSDTTQEWFENRLAWQQRLRDVLERDRQHPAFADRLAEVLNTPDAHWSDAYRAAVAENRQRTLVLLVDLHASARDRQRRRLVNEVSSLSDQFDRLACTAPNTAPKTPTSVRFETSAAR